MGRLEVTMVDEKRRDALKVVIGATAALGVGMLATPLVGSLVGNRIGYAKPETSGAIRVKLCEDVDRCPEEYSVAVSELRNGPVFKLIKVGTMAIPALFGLVQVREGGQVKEYPVAYVTICTHFGCPVNAVGSPYLIGFACPCHGSQFSICTSPQGCPTPDGGQAPFLAAYVSAGPAPRPLRAVKLAVKGDRVYAVEAYV